MYKKIILSVGLFSVAALAQAITLGPNLLSNSPSHFLIHLEANINDPFLAKQIGDELFSRDYLSTVSTYTQIVACFNQQPQTPHVGYTFDEGSWVWIPDTLGTNTGIWYWVLKPFSSLFELLYYFVLNPL